MEIKKEIHPFIENLFQLEFNTFQNLVFYSVKFLTLVNVSEEKPDDKYNNEVSSLVYIFLESCKRDLDGLEFATFLEDFAYTDEKKIKFLVKEFENKKEKIKHHNLFNKGFEFPKLKNVEWRLDYVLKTNKIRKYNQTLYTIKFIFDKTDSFLIFTCTIEQLKDLISKFKDAEKQFERILKK